MSTFFVLLVSLSLSLSEFIISWTQRHNQYSARCMYANYTRIYNSFHPILKFSNIYQNNAQIHYEFASLHNFEIGKKSQPNPSLGDQQVGKCIFKIIRTCGAFIMCSHHNNIIFEKIHFLIRSYIFSSQIHIQSTICC